MRSKSLKRNQKGFFKGHLFKQAQKQFEVELANDSDITYSVQMLQIT